MKNGLITILCKVYNGNVPILWMILYIYIDILVACVYNGDRIPA